MIGCSGGMLGTLGYSSLTAASCSFCCFLFFSDEDLGFGFEASALVLAIVAMTSRIDFVLCGWGRAALQN
jgi:hypothetical protein